MVGVLETRHVRGALFLDYVRMLRRSRNTSAEQLLTAEDLQYLNARIDPAAWYPMASFERMGLAILRDISGATLDAVRLWGRFSGNQFAIEHPELISASEPLETLMRLKVLRGTLFDFNAFDMPMLIDGHAYVALNYYMGPIAEEAACHQTMGFCEAILSLAGAENVDAHFQERRWAGAERTLLVLEWHGPASIR